MQLPLEKEIQADIVKMLRSVGAGVYRIGTTRKKGDYQGTMQTPGIADLLAFVPVPLAASTLVTRCVQLWIEVKRPGGGLSAAQNLFRYQAQAAGCEYVVGGVDEVLDWLKVRGVVK